jgi:hypothetical protein
MPNFTTSLKSAKLLDNKLFGQTPVVLPYPKILGPVDAVSWSGSGRKWGAKANLDATYWHRLQLSQRSPAVHIHSFAQLARRDVPWRVHAAEDVAAISRIGNGAVEVTLCRVALSPQDCVLIAAPSLSA